MPHITQKVWRGLAGMGSASGGSFRKMRLMGPSLSAAPMLTLRWGCLHITPSTENVKQHHCSSDRHPLLDRHSMFYSHEKSAQPAGRTRNLASTRVICAAADSAMCATGQVAQPQHGCLWLSRGQARLANKAARKAEAESGCGGGALRGFRSAGSCSHCSGGRAPGEGIGLLPYLPEIPVLACKNTE